MHTNILKYREKIKVVRCFFFGGIKTKLTTYYNYYIIKLY